MVDTREEIGNKLLLAGLVVILVIVTITLAISSTTCTTCSLEITDQQYSKLELERVSFHNIEFYFHKKCLRESLLNEQSEFHLIALQIKKCVERNYSYVVVD